MFALIYLLGLHLHATPAELHETPATAEILTAHGGAR